jgi:hypothetical protein
MTMLRLFAALALAGILAGCTGSAAAPSMSDAAKIWCAKHDGTTLAVAGGYDDLVLQAADKLNIKVPDKLKAANAYFSLWNMTGNPPPGDIPDGWYNEQQAWRQTADYARACVAAFESR